MGPLVAEAAAGEPTAGLGADSCSGRSQADSRRQSSQGQPGRWWFTSSNVPDTGSVRLAIAATLPARESIAAPNKPSGSAQLVPMILGRHPLSTATPCEVCVTITGRGVMRRTRRATKRGDTPAQQRSV